MGLRLIVLVLSVSFAISEELPSVLPSLEELVLPYGYPFESHTVRTEDGYNLALYRIPHGPSQNVSTTGRPRPVVYLQHGLLDTCAAFLMNGPAGSLGFVLADSGFDVWLGNSRGNTYSNYHLQYNMLQTQFWDFSLDELAKYDLPATLQYVLDSTGVKKLMYVGHSQGTASAHALFSTQHPITERISLAFMLSPVAFVEHITSIFLKGLARYRLEDLLTTFGFHQFLPTLKNLHTIAGPFCRNTGYACADVYSIIFGYNPENLDKTKWGIYTTYTPAGASIKIMAHWAQGVRSRYGHRFEKYDYGTKCWDWWRMQRLKCNWNIYRSREPPVYDLSNIRVPMVYYYGGHDALADLLDVEDLKELLTPGVLVEEHLELDYAHVDFIWGSDLKRRVFPKIIQTMKRRVLEDALSEHDDVIVVT